MEGRSRKRRSRRARRWNRRRRAGVRNCRSVVGGSRVVGVKTNTSSSWPVTPGTTKASSVDREILPGGIDRGGVDVLGGTSRAPRRSRRRRGRRCPVVRSPKEVGVKASRSSSRAVAPDGDAEPVVEMKILVRLLGARPRRRRAHLPSGRRRSRRSEAGRSRSSSLRATSRRTGRGQSRRRAPRSPVPSPARRRRSASLCRAMRTHRCEGSRGHVGAVERETEARRPSIGHDVLIRRGHTADRRGST